MRTAKTAQADLSLRWEHMPFCWFCHEAAHIAMMDSLRQQFYSRMRQAGRDRNISDVNNHRKGYSFLAMSILWLYRRPRNSVIATSHKKSAFNMADVNVTR